MDLPTSEEARAVLEAVAGGRLSELAVADQRQVLLFPEEADIGDLRLLHDSESSVLVPIRTGSRLLGFLLVESRQKSHFSADRQLIEVLASHAAVSLNRVQLLSTERDLLLSANAIMAGQIATTFLHEAKNALNAIYVMVLSLHEEIGREAALKKKKVYLGRLSAVQSEVARLGDLSTRLQKFSQQGLRPEKQEAYVNDVVTKTMELLDVALRAKEIRPKVKLDDSLKRPTEGKGGNPAFVDERQIQQVLMNLILNALAASPARQSLLVETRNLAKSIEIRITDFGCGIAPEDRRQLFRPFFTTKEDGVGLGLFVSRILIEDNHQGTIEIVRSVPGKGSTFAVQLPKNGRKKRRV